jgi:hypothetical protein
MLDRPNFGGVFPFIVHLMREGPSRSLAAVSWAVTGLLGSAAGLPLLALAMHETDHRFTVSGYVRDKEGKPVGDARVHVRDLRDQKVEPVTTYTDGTGYYKAVLHLHTHNEGDPIQVTAIDEKRGLEELKKVRADFSPGDRTTERVAKVDIGPVPEGQSVASEGSAYWWYLVGGALISGTVAFLWSRRRQPKARQTRRGKKRQQS